MVHFPVYISISRPQPGDPGAGALKHTGGLLVQGLLVLLILISRTARAEEDAVLQVTIADPFIELHTGPGTGYPDFSYY